jgi:phenylpropionate dioxygenase-like ring-hydroxylating dioxygenase large terminal subunit
MGMSKTSTSMLDNDHVAADSSDEAYSLPSHYYTDPDILRLECEHIFYRSWNFSGHVSQLTKCGDYVTCTVGEESIIVMRGEDEQLRGFYNVCRHRGHWLLEGEGHVSAINCPYHAWRYATDGQLVYARNSDKVPGFDRSAFCLKQVRVEVFCGFVFVNLDVDAVPLEEQVPGFADELRAYEPHVDELTLVYRKRFTVESNWKNVVDNYNENYHTPVVHPVLASILDDSYHVDLKGKYLSHVSDATAGESGGFEVQGQAYAQHLTWWLWPNLCPMSIPGGGLRVLHIMPDGPQRTRETYDFYMPYAEPTEEQWKQINFAADVVNVEDLGVAEGIQRGLRSRSFDRSYIMLDPNRGEWSEHAVSHFKKLVLEALHGTSA